MELKHEKINNDIENVVTFNRTLWNWNVWVKENTERSRKLLIVPYGIETAAEAAELAKKIVLLIVPYGIETQNAVLNAFMYQSF